MPTILIDDDSEAAKATAANILYGADYGNCCCGHHQAAGLTLRADCGESLLKRFPGCGQGKLNLLVAAPEDRAAG